MKMNEKQIAVLKESNRQAMEVLADLRAEADVTNLIMANLSEEFAKDTPTEIIQTIAVNNAIDALYMQNKMLDVIEGLKDKDCFETDNKGVIQLLSSFVATGKTSEV